MRRWYELFEMISSKLKTLHNISDIHSTIFISYSHHPLFAIFNNRYMGDENYNQDKLTISKSKAVPYTVLCLASI